jgi:phospholipid/cholesterol/gamma-HCH transport system permease protein
VIPTGTTRAPAASAPAELQPRVRKRRPSGSATGPRPIESLSGVLEQVAGIILLTGKTIWACVTPPVSWRYDFVEESWLILKRCTLPVVVSTFLFGFGAPGLQGDNILQIFGSLDRGGAFFVMASVREFAPWINGMVIAGVAGTAICADLGARKVREELDALAVLGLDPVRTLVVPRFLALGTMTASMNLVAIVCGILGGWAVTLLVFGQSTAGYLATFTSNFTVPELLGSVVKTSLFGFIIAAVCCYKGMNVKGGPEGVGRAVNQAVVIAFAAIWVFNSVFTATLLASFPEMGNLH